MWVIHISLSIKRSQWIFSEEEAVKVSQRRARAALSSWANCRASCRVAKYLSSRLCSVQWRRARVVRLEPLREWWAAGHWSSTRPSECVPLKRFRSRGPRRCALFVSCSSRKLSAWEGFSTGMISEAALQEVEFDAEYTSTSIICAVTKLIYTTV